ncbi:hypothetical protein [Sediminibacillus sp. JSM 1682029]|uniref:hypothetical protein n=1 Tax=Sediminibacillus sp. JSM 1682029 TaxID=3229857 RepID=UPI00352687E4
MNLKLLLSSLIVGLGVYLVVIPNSVSADVQKDNVPLQGLKFYDENNERIYPYSLEELKAFQEIHNIVQDWKIDTFTSASFINTVLIANGRPYYNPGSVILKTYNSANPMSIEAYETDNSLAGSVYVPSGWEGSTNVPFTHLDRGHSYYFQIRNEAATTAHIAGGEVWYDN